MHAPMKALAKHPLILKSGRYDWMCPHGDWLPTGGAATANGAVSASTAADGSFGSATGGSGQTPLMQTGGNAGASSASSSEMAADSGLKMLTHDNLHAQWPSVACGILQTLSECSPCLAHGKERSPPSSALTCGSPTVRGGHAAR